MRPDLIDLDRLALGSDFGGGSSVPVPELSTVRVDMEVLTGTPDGLLIWMGKERSVSYFGGYDQEYFFALGGEAGGRGRQGRQGQGREYI